MLPFCLRFHCLFLAYRISSNNSLPSNNQPPLMEIFKIIASPPPLLSSSLSFIPSVEWWSSKTDQCRFKLSKLIKQPNLEHLKSPFSVYLMWYFWFNGIIINKIFRLRLLVSYILNNRLPQIICFPRTIAPFWYEKRKNCARLLFEKIR